MKKVTEKSIEMTQMRSTKIRKMFDIEIEALREKESVAKKPVLKDHHIKTEKPSIRMMMIQDLKRSWEAACIKHENNSFKVRVS